MAELKVKSNYKFAKKFVKSLLKIELLFCKVIHKFV